MSVNNDGSQGPVASPNQVRAHLLDLRHLMMLYRFGVEEIMTKVNILRDEFRLVHDYNPIEHVGSRVKSIESILQKAVRKGIDLSPSSLREHMFDIAGVRLTCSFVTDIYRMRGLLINQPDITLIEERDYIANPKPNGYKSLHLIVKIPVFLTDRVENVLVEIQLRTIAMDFWASLEHKIYYKYDKAVPRHLTDALKLAADVASSLDTSMERIHEEIHELETASLLEEQSLEESQNYVTAAADAPLSPPTDEFITALLRAAADDPGVGPMRNS